MSVRTRFLPEDVQTYNDVGLFDDAMEDDTSQPSNMIINTVPPIRSSGEIDQMDLEETVEDVTSPPATRTVLDKRERLHVQKKQVVNKTSDKRRIKEVDYSETLRQTVYSQEEQINTMRREMQMQNDIKKQWEAALREREEQLEKVHQELETMHVDIVAWQENHAQQQENHAQQQKQLEDYIRESRETLSQANREAIDAGMHKILEETHERFTQELRRREAELGEELARREEELRKRKEEECREQSSAIFTEMERRLQHEIEKLKAEKRRDTGQSSAPSAKPSLGTPCLDAIRRIKRTRGVSRRTRLVSIVAEVNTEEVPRESSEEDVPPPEQHNPLPRASLSMEDAITRGVEAALRRVLVDKEFSGLKKCSPQRRKTEEEEVQREKASESNYERDFLLPKVTAKGVLETPAEVEERLIVKKDELLKKYLRRATVLDHLVKQKTDDKEEDLPAWQWLQQLVKTLGECGMSSEESDLENDIETVLRVKNMVWRRAVERKLDIVDHQRLADDDIFAPQGSKPMKRIRAAGNPKTSRVPAEELPKALYSEEWLMGLSKRQVEKLSISDKRFKWMQVAVV
ncbi:uncharacterized protein F5891DRAFT_983797 [Suillus fuscotomentosus]|uniref:Uncharacterized protein n=1 Tax=Suillus fuscotomentosus TaxID=1912939 RepID=A0AAD4HFP5_9AGAM|nr:uncharacterized protein F5891DRAFT_983797 [Suillus fuscotomentosus]KAG1895935.1 hypothetical protein F5891DRAFT_983797 [Suillus fuscotomentosus]